MIFNFKKIKKDFPVLTRKINGRAIVYFDNAATTQKPKIITERLKKLYAHSYANVHRGAYQMAEEITKEFELSRQKAADFIGAQSSKEIIFTRNATEAVNLVAYSLGRKFKRGDRILTTISEHHSNFVPWLRLARERGLKLDIVKLTSTRDFDFTDFRKKLTKKTKLVAVAHISNVSGYIYPVEKICKEAHKVGALILIDGAQSAGHIPVNVRKIGCDFFAFSGHKMLAPSGIGALWGRSEILESMEPFMSGGEMIREVTAKSVTWNDLPWKFEAGTPNIEGAILFGEAIDYLKKIGMKNIEHHERELLKYALEKMKKLPFVDLLGFEKTKDRTGIISFNICGVTYFQQLSKICYRDGIHPHDAATMLDRYGIAVRAGHHCAQPLMKHLGVLATLRASFYIYNTKEEIDYFIRALKEIHKKFVRTVW
ncbi:MAG: SufS family cysteine desulfurase [Candidatus Niyogibacteria bacterium]|nr:MAG: SufS family cysteine desulfurase [Candidatus Niyogibacteria bacterium]